MPLLYQQNQKIEIIVRKEETGGTAQAEETTPEESGGGGTTWRTAVFGSESPERIKRVVKTNATHILAVARQAAGIMINYKLTGLGYETGDQSYQELVQRRVEIVQDTTSFASSVAMGAVYGAWGGPIGAAIGATLGAVQSAISIGTKYKTREREYSVKMFKQENGIEYMRARASINLTTGRLR